MLLAFGIIALASPSAKAQSVAGRIAFGFDAGGNKYYGNYTDSRFGFQGDAFIRWNIMDWLSLVGSYNGGVLAYKSTGAIGEGGSIGNEHTLFPVSSGTDGSPVGSINHTREGGWDLMASFNVFPAQTFVPYFTAGIEALNFEPDDASPLPLRGNAVNAYSKNVLGGAFGVGFEMYLSPKITFNGKGLLHLTGTDWMDDYSDPNNYRQDAYLTMGLGFSYYIFAPDAAPAAAIAEATTTTNNYTTNTTVYHTDTLYIQNPTDTVYFENPKVNTVFNFPGTLFIVNTDQFNNAEPNNMEHLYHIKALVDQCPSLRVEIEGFASEEGTSEHNQTLSEERANRIKSWLIEKGVSSDKIASTVGYGDTRPAVRERTDVSATQLEAERAQNRRIAVKVVQACQETGSTNPSN